MDIKGQIVLPGGSWIPCHTDAQYERITASIRRLGDPTWDLLLQISGHMLSCCDRSHPHYERLCQLQDRLRIELGLIDGSES